MAAADVKHVVGIKARMVTESPPYVEHGYSFCRQGGAVRMCFLPAPGVSSEAERRVLNFSALLELQFD